MEKILRPLHFLFLNVPARSTFALPFCGHRWVENLPVAERALQIWPNILKYVAAVRSKDVNNPATSSYDTIEVAAKDPFVIAKLEVFTAVCRNVSPFLTKYQTDAPVLPFIAHDLAELLKSLLRRFVKIDLLRDATPAQLVHLDVTEKEARVPVGTIDIGIGAENAIKVTQSPSSLPSCCHWKCGTGRSYLPSNLWRSGWMFSSILTSVILTPSCGLSSRSCYCPHTDRPQLKGASR